MKNKWYYILNRKTDQSYDPIEDKFFDNNWEPVLDDDKDYLQNIINSDPERFRDCVVTKVSNK